MQLEVSPLYSSANPELEQVVRTLRHRVGCPMEDNADPTAWSEDSACTYDPQLGMYLSETRCAVCALRRLDAITTGSGPADPYAQVGGLVHARHSAPPDRRLETAQSTTHCHPGASPCRPPPYW